MKGKLIPIFTLVFILCLISSYIGCAVAPGAGGTTKVILPSGVGGSLDTMTRGIAPHLEQALNPKIVIENRRGGGGSEDIRIKIPDAVFHLLPVIPENLGRHHIRF